MTIPGHIDDRDQLEELLSRPCAGVEAALADLDGELVVLGAGGKMGPTLSRMACRAGAEVVAVSRFGGTDRDELTRHGVRTVVADLLDPAAVAALPDAAAVVFMAGMKFGTSASPASTWAMNAHLPGLVAQRYAGVPTVVFSSGNVYPFVPVGRGADESTPPAPIGEYAQSVLARERIFEHFSDVAGTPAVLLRLNYAVEPRYGVLVDIATAVRDGRPIDLATGHVNVIWQGDANRYALRCLGLCTEPPRIVNVTGAAALSVRELAERFGDRFGERPRFTGIEGATALLSDASMVIRGLGPPEVDVDHLIEWTAAWLERGGETFGKPTHYDVRDGAF